MRKLKLARKFIEAQGGFVSTQPKEEFTCLVCETRFEDVTKQNNFGIVVPVHGCPKCAAQHHAHLTATPYCPHISENIDGTCPYCKLPKPPQVTQAARRPPSVGE